MAAQTHEITVRHKVIWTGVAVALAGMVGTGLMLVLPVDRLWSLLGLVVIGAGLLVAWRGGIMGDVHGGAGRGSTTSGVVPGARSSDPDAREQAVSANRRAEAQMGQATDPTRPPASPFEVAALALVALAAWLTCSPWLLGFFLEEDGMGDVVLNQAIAGVLVGLCGLYLHQVGRSVPVSGLAALVALGVVADGLFRHTLSTTHDANQVVVGVLMLAAAGASARARAGADRR